MSVSMWAMERAHGGRGGAKGRTEVKRETAALYPLPRSVAETKRRAPASTTCKTPPGSRQNTWPQPLVSPHPNLTPPSHSQPNLALSLALSLAPSL